MPERSRPQKKRRRRTDSRKDWGREPLKFDHGHIEQSPKESQDRLFEARRQQAKRQRRREKRDEKMKGFILPLFVSVVILSLLLVAGWRMWASRQEAGEKLSRGTEVREKRKAVPPPVNAAEVEVEEARNRFLLRGSESPEGGTFSSEPKGE